MISRTSRSLLVLLLAAVICLATCQDVSPAPFHCPESCTCSKLAVGHRDLKHARCESVEALHDKQWPVQSLDLSGLGLTKVPAAVEKLRNLTRLNLSNNHISEVARMSNRIQELDLSHNRIGSGKLAKLPVLVRKLNLAHNHITIVPEVLKKLEHLHEIELSGNPINCSCDTIQVRNWLQSRHVWSEVAIKCASPQKYKGHPWLQVKQSELCHMTPAEIEEEKNIWEDSNDLMMGDQPAAGEDHEEYQEEHDALEEDYMRVDDDDFRGKPHGEDDAELEEGSGHMSSPDPMLHKSAMDIVEGSGHDVFVPRINVESSTISGPDDEDEEGSGLPILPPIIHTGRTNLDAKPKPKHEEEFHEDTINPKEEEEPIKAPEEDHTTPTSPKDLGIFQEQDDDVEAPIVKDNAPTNSAGPDTIGSKVIITGPTGNLENHDPTDQADSRKLYILLAIILIVMIALIVIVVVKQKNAKRRNRRNGQNDVEAAKLTELQDMNQRLIGKPLDKKGNGEHAPLIGDREKSDFAKPINGQRDCEKIGFNPYESPASPDTDKQVPLKGADEQPIERSDHQALNSFKPAERAESKDSINENNNNNNNNADDLNNNQFQPISNGYPQENGVGHTLPSVDSPPGVHKPNKDEEWEKYTPRSPDMKRYSPVYSPETGRVKIRLSETPKPKTPLLVTRSRSNAGQMILTPNLSQRQSNGEATES